MKKDMFIYIADIIESMDAIEKYVMGLERNRASHLPFKLQEILPV